MLVFLFSWIIIKVLRQTQIKISALNIYCKDCHMTFYQCLVYLGTVHYTGFGLGVAETVVG